MLSDPHEVKELTRLGCQIAGRARGTCDDARCPYHGRCHCRCGSRTMRSDQGHIIKGYQRGMPLMYLHGHAPGCKQALEGRGYRPWSGEPIASVLPMLRAVVADKGRNGAARAIGVDNATVWGIMTGRRKQNVSRRTAVKIRAAYERLHPHLPAMVPTGPLREFMLRHEQLVLTAFARNSADNRAVYRKALSLYRADEIATRLGAHPIEIWPDWYALDELSGTKDVA